MDGVWQTVSSTVTREFSDVRDLAEFTRLTLRLTMALLLGGLLGWQRERAGKVAGVRTHMLVSLGAALFVLVSAQAGATSADLSRVVQGIVTGIGFLGAGAILKPHEESRVVGLTTAAGIWLTAAVGIAAGLGREALAVLCTILALVVFALIPKLGTDRSDEE